MRAAGFTDIAPHVNDADQQDCGGGAARPFRVADIEDVTFLNFPDPFTSAAPPQLHGHGSAHGSMHGSIHGSIHGSLRGSGSLHAGSGSLHRGSGSVGAMLVAAAAAAEAAPLSARAAATAGAAGRASGQLTQILRHAHGTGPQDPEATPRADAPPQGGAPGDGPSVADASAHMEEDWARVHLVLLTGSASTTDCPAEERGHSGTPSPATLSACISLFHRTC